MFGRRGLFAISKLAQTSLLGSSKFVPQLATTTTARLFSQTLPRCSIELVETLKNEIDEEKRLQKEQKTTRPVITGFDVKTNGSIVTATKKHGNETVKIIFDVSHTVDINEEFEDGDEEASPISTPPLELNIIKGDKKLVFELDLVQGEDEGFDYQVQEFYLANAADEKTPDHTYRSSGGYIDPSLGDLLFKRYLEDRSINADLLQQVVDFATYYEHEQYVKLLESLKNFVEK